jgi:hypothetical protein
MVAPVCHVSKDQVIVQPAPKALPSIPNATDLPSALAAIAALKKTIELITQPININNSTNVSAQPAKPQRWSQASRTTERVKITNPADQSQFVEIERIKALTMKDQITGETWVWKR